MALKREFLKAMGLDDEKISAIIESHAETVTALKKERDDYKATAESLQGVAKERDGLKEQLAKVGDSTQLRAEFDAYKQQVENEKQEAKITEEVTAICKEAGIARDSFLRAVGREFDRSKIKRGEDGTISNRDALVEYVKKDFADFGSTTEERGTPPVTPPAGGYKGMTKEQIGAITNTAERRAAIAANLDLFN